MVLPTSPAHSAAREQVALALCEAIDEMFVALVKVQSRLREWAGLPPKDVLEEEPATAKVNGKKRTPERPGVTTGRSSEVPEPTKDGSGPPSRQAGVTAGETAPFPVPPDVALNPRKARAYQAGALVGASGEPPKSPYGENPQGAASWLDTAWQLGWAAGRKQFDGARS